MNKTTNIDIDNCLYNIDEKECEHLYRDASDSRYCVDCGKKLDYEK
jgi:hypothetical protein